MAAVKNSVAILIQGPPRYIVQVVGQLERSLADRYHKYFIFLWDRDAGVKSRNGPEGDIENKLRSFSNVEELVIERPLELKEYQKRYGSYINTHSSLEAVFGMFYSISKLITIAGRRLDLFDFVLRYRTDILLHDDRVLEKCSWKRGELYHAYDLEMPSDWVNDQIMASEPEIFKKIWSFGDLEEIAQLFVKSARNPEKMLTARVINATRLVPVKSISIWQRYRDYELVYNPPRKGDYAWLKKALKEGSIDELFTHALKKRDLQEISLKCSKLERIGYLSDPYKYEWINRARFAVRDYYWFKILSRIRLKLKGLPV